MNSLERVFAALELRQPDRVPVLEWVIHEQVAKAAVPGCIDAADCADQLDMDAVACYAQFDTLETRADGTYRDEWGVWYKPSIQAIAHPVEGPIATMDDFRAYTPPDPDAPQRLTMLRDYVRRYKGKRAIVFLHRAAFMHSAYLMGLDNLLMNFLADPPLVDAVMDMVLDTNMAVVGNAIRAGADVVVMADDYAHNRGPMMSPESFERFILPRLRRMAAFVREQGAYAVKHTDGHLYPILEGLVSCGAHGLNPLEPVAGMDIAKLKREIGDRICLIGNIDCGHLLPFGTPDDVRESVRETIAAAGKGGGYILSSSNCIHASCKPENFLAMVRATHEFGKY